MIRFLRNLFRLLVVVYTLARHNALPVEELRDVAPGLAMLARSFNRVFGQEGFPRRVGERLAAAFSELGPSYIKLGQILSTRSDLVGDQVAADLAQLQDRLPPFSFDEARAIIEDQFDRRLEDLFERFEPKPVAAASIAQVHFAVVPSPVTETDEPDSVEEREVAVKVLRPGIEAAFRRDLDLFRWLADLVLWVQPRLRRLKPHEVIDTFAETVTLEMDLRMEAAAASELAVNFRDDPTFNVPRVDWDRTSKRVLTLQRIRGVKVDEVEAIRAAGIDPDAVLAKASAAFFNQVFRDGFFHADLHPGNLFVDADGNIVAVDFGIMGRVDRATRTYLADMLLGFLNGDYRRVAEVHFQAGYVPAHQSIDLFTQACRAIGEPLLNRPLHEISVGRLLAQLFAVTEQFQMETQPQLLLLQKSMLTAEGVGRILNPRINMWELVRPLIEAWMRENRGPEARVADNLAALVDTLGRLPDTLRISERAARRITEQGVRLDDETIRTLLNGYGAKRQRLVWRLWLATAVLAMALAALVS